MIVEIEITCESEFNLRDGTATATPSGGTAPYTYLWDTGATTQTVTDLTTGWHRVRVEDNVGAVQVVYVAITLCEQQYSFNMNDSELACFLQVASCRFGDKAHDLFTKNSMGIRDKCCEKDLFLLHKNIETAACWRPQSVVSVEQPSYHVTKFISYAPLSDDSRLVITVLDWHIAMLWDFSKDLAGNLITLVDGINGEGRFKAQTDGFNFWLFAPSGYCGVPVTVHEDGDEIEFEVITTNGFQDGSLPCGSYVDFYGEYHEAPEDCLSQDQVGNIIDNIKKYVNCGCEATEEILNDDV